MICCYGLLSRGKADLVIKKGRVKWNGRQAILGEKADPFSDHILVVGRDLSKKLSLKFFLEINLMGSYLATRLFMEGKRF